MKALFVAYIFCIYFPQASDLSQVDEWVTGVAKAPYDPKYNNTAIMTADGNLYSATVTDFKGRDPAICRIMGPSAHLRSVQYNNKWLHGMFFQYDWCQQKSTLIEYLLQAIEKEFAILL